MTVFCSNKVKLTSKPASNVSYCIVYWKTEDSFRNLSLFIQILLVRVIKAPKLR